MSENSTKVSRQWFEIESFIIVSILQINLLLYLKSKCLLRELNIESNNLPIKSKHELHI